MAASTRISPRLLSCFIASALSVGVCSAAPFFISTGNPDGLIATASRPASAGKIEIESADDFLIPGSSLTTLNSATFTGLLTAATIADIGEIRVEIYRLFPSDSNVARTSGPPTFSTSQVPTRVNSPSDVELLDRDTASGNLTFTTSDLGSFTAGNSIINGINPIPNQHTGGEGPVTGEEIQFNVNFTVPILLVPGHYFFVPQVELTNSGEFLWLSAPRPIVPPGTPFLPDLQSWIRNENLAPDWLRIGSDIVGTPQTGPTFNATFSLTGAVPEPGSLVLVGAGLVVAWWWWRRGKRPDAPDDPTVKRRR
jgi:hypothetical protein